MNFFPQHKLTPEETQFPNFFSACYLRLLDEKSLYIQGKDFGQDVLLWEKKERRFVYADLNLFGNFAKISFSPILDY